MRRILSVILSAVALMTVTFTANADSEIAVPISEETVYFSDGSFATVALYESNTAAVYSDTYTKSGSKVYAMKDKDGNVLWKFTLKGSFKVNSGVSAVCTSATYSSKIENGNWSLKTATASKTSNKAVGDATYQLKVLLIIKSEKSCHLELKCDKNGVIS